MAEHAQQVAVFRLQQLGRKGEVLRREREELHSQLQDSHLVSEQGLKAALANLSAWMRDQLHLGEEVRSKLALELSYRMRRPILRPLGDGAAI